MSKQHDSNKRSRRGVTLVLAAFLMVLMLGMVAFAVDCGYMVLVRSQLQGAADAAAMAAAEVMGSTQTDPVATAQQFAAYHNAGGRQINLANSDIEYGVWNSSTLTFTPTTQIGNALRITARMDATHGGGQAPLFFGRVLGRDGFDAAAQAVAMGNPRDICFVVDLSGSMNNDTEPAWAPACMTSLNASYSTISNNMMQQVFTDFGYGTYPGTSQWVGQPVGVAQNNNAYANLTANGGPLTLSTVSSTYKILSTDSEATRKTKAYKWIIDNQIAAVMPQAKPTPSSSSNLTYWTYYLDYILPSVSVSGRGTLPPSQSSTRIDSMDNPCTDSYPSATASIPQSWRNKIGYVTYVQFMMDNGRDRKPDGTNYTPLSTNSPFCPFHSEGTAGGTFSFPPSEQPTHAARRSIIAAIQQIKSKNSVVSDPNQCDWVSVVTFDTVAGTVLKQPLTSNYDTAMQACTTLQAVSDAAASTATETGLIAAQNHIKPASQGGAGRENSQKVIVLLTDGMANLKTSSNSAVSSYTSAHPNSNFISGTTSNDNAMNAALMETNMVQATNWQLYAVALGLGADYDFMDRMARMGDTANDDGQAPRTSGDPSAYEAELTAIFQNIIENPHVHLVR
jgi:Putative Flp pilus-assembly TadE/G-like/von Willebrand factor type A domain